MHDDFDWLLIDDGDSALDRTKKYPRSTLYNIEPLGLGSQNREGLVSYIVRLARAHHVNPRHLIKLIFGKDDKSFQELCYNSFYVEYSGTTNGTGRYARLFAAAANRLTGRKDMETLTMLPWSELIPENSEGLLAKNPRWCSYCFIEQILMSGESYTPLRWSLNLHTHCEEHNCPMQDKCAHCGKHQPFIPRIANVAQCDHCGEWLYSRSLTAIDDADSLMAVPEWRPRVQMLGQMIEGNSGSEGKISLEGFRTSLRRAIDSANGGNKAKFCRSMGWNNWAANAWLDKGKKPSFPIIVELGLKLGVNPMDLCRGIIPDGGFAGSPLEGPKTISRIVARASRPQLTSLEIGTVSQLLQQALDNDQVPPSLREIGAESGLRRSSLKYWFPDLCDRICEKRSVAKKAAAETRNRVLQATVTDIVQGMLAQGIYPVRRKVDSELKKHGVALARPELFRAYSKALRRSC